MSDLPPVAYLTRGGQWFARAYEHLETIRYVLADPSGTGDTYLTPAVMRRYADLEDAIRAIVDAYDLADGNEWDAPIGVHAAIDAARALLEGT